MALCGYNGGYLSSASIDNLVGGLQNGYPDFCKVINLKPSREGRPIRAVKIGKGTGTDRRGVLLLGGLHARELLNPDSLIYFAYNLAFAYKNNQNYSMGAKTYTAAFVKMLVENMDIFILPLANPDGREFVLSPNGDRMWRGNRAPNPGKACKGVDLNRNFDFLWTSGIRTDAEACSPNQIYKGPSAFSEPESKNVRQLLDTFPHIVGMIDVHSYSEFVMHPWGDDENQTTQPTMNFNNALFNGQRGLTGDNYKEYIPKKDLDWFVSVGNSMAQAIQAVRGRKYTVQQSLHLYATSATSTDYSYSRQYVSKSKRKVLAYCIETGPEVWKNGVPDYLASFQPAFPEASCIMEDVQPAFMEFCVNILSVSGELVDSVKQAASASVVSTAAASRAAASAGAARSSAAGRRFAKFLEDNRDELLVLARTDQRLLRESGVVLKRLLPIIQSHQSDEPQAFDEALVKRVDDLLGRLSEQGTPKLRRGAAAIRQDLQSFAGRTVVEALRKVDARSRRGK
ncbi:MAG TPA: M14 family zinc carboxypeptidase [Pyrinomonadaceae bacterium]|nr:M14 family zinc carboxypeptidase [Pyrinomonadaceae bacterium]